MIALAIFVTAVGLYVATAAVIDARIHRIPNYLTVPTAVAGLVYHTVAPLVAPDGWALGPWMSLAGFGVGFLLLIVPWLFGGGGMGDVKLLAALGAWLGPKWMLVAFFISVVVGCLLALIVLLAGVANQGVSKTGRRFLGARRPADKKTNKKRPARVMPFAVPVAISTWMVLALLVTRGGL